MASRKPIVDVAGVREEMPTGDTVPVDAIPQLAISKVDDLETELEAKQPTTSTLTAFLVAASTATEGQAVVSDGAGGWLVVDMPEGTPMLEIDDATDFGDGSSGAVTYSSNTTITADVNATTLTVNAGAVVTVGWNSSASRPAIIKATTSIIVRGRIIANGSDTAASTTGGASVTGGGGGGGAGTPSSGTAGGASGRPSHNGESRTVGQYTGGGGGGGAGGGSGGPGSSYAGGAGGRTIVPSVGSFSSLSSLIAFASSVYGGGGGGGGYQTTASTGGGGGGGTIILLSPIVSISGSVEAKGGSVAGGGPSVAPGGAGGGGCILVVARTFGTVPSSLSVAGGTVPTSGVYSFSEAGKEGVLLLALEAFPNSTASFWPVQLAPA